MIEINDHHIAINFISDLLFAQEEMKVTLKSQVWNPN